MAVFRDFYRHQTILSNRNNLIRTQSDIHFHLGRTIQKKKTLRNTIFSNFQFNSLPESLFNRLSKDVCNITSWPNQAKMTFKCSLDSLLSHINDQPQLLQYSIYPGSIKLSTAPQIPSPGTTQSMWGENPDQRSMSLNAIIK